ncbi:hypothetical protein Pfo_031614 [Paulownia fortunei]|nr:hypothetical protein Pfo_031614 [Paulownia fortunei]
MAPKRTGLGRGIGALIPTASDQQDRPVDDLVAVPGARLANLNPLDVVPNGQQPRKEFAKEELQELVHSIREIGVLQPIVVRPIAGASGTEAQYELIMGERRLRATKELGLATIPAIVKDTPDDAMLRDALLENLHRAQLNPLEEASAYQQLLADFGITQEQLAQRIGRSRPQITNTIRLLRLPSPVQRRVAAGVLSADTHVPSSRHRTRGDGVPRREDRQRGPLRRAAEAIAQQLSAKTPVKPKAEPTKRQAHFNDLAERIGDRSVTIDFANGDDLNRILGELGISDIAG